LSTTDLMNAKTIGIIVGVVVIVIAAVVAAIMLTTKPMATTSPMLSVSAAPGSGVPELYKEVVCWVCSLTSLMG